MFREQTLGGSRRPAIPDFRPDFPIFFTASARGFDGAVRTVNGKPALLFGVDVIARVQTSEALPAFFDHELFHRYHAQAAESRDELYFNLWQEGLATYVSHALNPQVSESAILGRPADLADRARPHVAQIARELLDKLDSQSEDDSRQYFLGDSPRADIPPRSGYYIGYLVAGKLAARHSLVELAHMQGPELKAEIQGALQSLSTPAS